ncbi:MAG TPA: prohibitin family protein [Rhodothermales bacterium]|nr:prohibitin family protein [Rhodothermales bacterium]
MASNSYPNLTRAIIRTAVGVLIFLVVISMAAGCMTTTIQSGEAGVRYSPFGGTDLSQTYGEGIKVHAPWVSVIEYDVRVQEKMEELDALSSNGLAIGMDVSVRWRPISEELPNLHTNYGPDYYRKLVQPEMRSAVREVVGRFTPEELYSTRRTELQEQIQARVEQGVEGRYVQVDAVLIRDLRLPEQIQVAIQNKLKEEQEAERYEFTIRKEELEAQRKKIEAEGEAEYQRIITASLSQQYLRFKGIEATQNLAASPNTKTIIVGAGESGLPLILGGQ